MSIEIEGRTEMETKLQNDKKRTIVSMSNWGKILFSQMNKF